MTRRPNWVTHKQKAPRIPFGIFASSTDSSTWRDYATACRAAKVGNVDGIGFVFDGNGIAGIDLDDCIHDGVLDDWAAEVLEMCPGTYVEVSPSGRGLHIFGFGTVGKGRRIGKVEVYDRGRFFTVTGNRWADCPTSLADIQSAITALAS